MNYVIKIQLPQCACIYCSLSWCCFERFLNARVELYFDFLYTLKCFYKLFKKKFNKVKERAEKTLFESAFLFEYVDDVTLSNLNKLSN